MKYWSIPLPNDWVLKGFKAIFKELSPDETLKKIDLDGAVCYNGENTQYIDCYAYPTNRYFRIDPVKVIVRKSRTLLNTVRRDQKTLLKRKNDKGRNKAIKAN